MMDRGALDRRQPKPLDAGQTARRVCFVLAVALTLPALAQPAVAQDVRHSVPFFPAAAVDARQGFVRMINHGAEAGEARVFAIDQGGARRGPLRLTIDANASVRRIGKTNLAQIVYCNSMALGLTVWHSQIA